MVGMVINAGVALLLVSVLAIYLPFAWLGVELSPIYHDAVVQLTSHSSFKHVSSAVRRLQKRELLVLSKEELKEVLAHGRILAVSGGREVAETKSSSSTGTPPVLSRGTLAAISSDLRIKMIAVGLLHA